MTNLIFITILAVIVCILCYFFILKKYIIKKNLPEQKSKMTDEEIRKEYEDSKARIRHEHEYRMEQIYRQTKGRAEFIKKSGDY